MEGGDIGEKKKEILSCLSFLSGGQDFQDQPSKGTEASSRGRLSGLKGRMAGCECSQEMVRGN